MDDKLNEDKMEVLFEEGEKMKCMNEICKGIWKERKENREETIKVVREKTNKESQLEVQITAIRLDKNKQKIDLCTLLKTTKNSKRY